MAVVARLPTLGLEQQLAPATHKKPIATNDEVASILKGLQLDRKFFLSRLDENQTKDLMLKENTEAEEEQASPARRRMSRMQTKVMKKTTCRAANKKTTDFDIYLGESLMPVLAQALDSLCRQVNRMQGQGDLLDPKVRARFNPLTWLAQQLLRRHPKCSKTPRRQAIYANFRNWADLERGKREMLRRRDVVQDVFEGFVLRGVVQRVDLEPVIAAIDDTLHLDGVLKDNKAMRSAFHLSTDEPDSPCMRRGSVARRGREDFFSKGGWDFVQFWKLFAQVLATNDVVPASVIQRGLQLQQQQALLRSEAEAARKKEAEDRRQYEAEQRRQCQEYAELYSELQENSHIQSILTESKVLTGDDVRPGDPGYEFEVPPNGPHVTLLWKLLILLGFDKLDKTKQDQKKPSSPGPGVELPEIAAKLTSDADNSLERTDSNGRPRWWDDELASAWTALQEIFHAEICDGVVEVGVLEKVLVPSNGYHVLRSKVLEEMEDRQDVDDLDVSKMSRQVSAATNTGLSRQKPSIETLCQRLGVTMSRMDWLHRLFESFLQPDENDPDKAPECHYPEAPAAIKKVQMRALMKELLPNMEEVEFEMRFRRIDTDLSGMVEFDEFVTWVREDEVRVAGAAPLQKMSFEELAVVYSESVELITYLYDQFQDRFPPDERDNYPQNPKSLGKADVRALVASLTPDMTDAEFETEFQMTTFSQKDKLEFDEFLEVLPLHELPDEIREEH